jgi:hypothetical protein
MRLSPRLLAASIVAVGSLVGSVRTIAQEDNSKPKPAAREYPPLIEGFGDQDANSDQQPATNLNPDTHPLTGVQTLTIGSPELRHSYWTPGFQYANFGRSSALNEHTSSGWNSTSFVTGNLSLVEAWNRSQLSVNYSGGGSFSTDKSQGNEYYHQLGLVQAFDWHRWQLSFIDQFSYLPQTQFGFGSSTNLPIPGVGGTLDHFLPGLLDRYVPNQSIFTSFGTRYSNAFATQLVYQLSARGSIAMAGSYGNLRFLEAGNVNSDDVIASFGYDYALTREDTIGAVYRFSGYHYPGNPQSIGDQVVHLAYGRKITGRLALQLFGGPDIISFRVPIGKITQKISGSGGSTLAFAFKSGSIDLAYSHGLSNGSGLLIGSDGDQLKAYADRQLSRLWRGHVYVGFARNGTIIGSQQISPSYDSWFIGAGLSRPLSRTANFTFGYAAYLENSRLPICAAGKCGTNYIQHQISVGFQWHTRPLVLR